MVLLIPKVKDSIEARGIAKGEARANQAARDWQQRKDAAEKAGQPFNEPPPWET